MLGSRPTPNPHRVLQAAGTVSPNFRWIDPSCLDDPSDLLADEGVKFDDAGRADPEQRVDAEHLALFAGLAPDDDEAAEADLSDAAPCLP
jgi:hypothetical protein